MRMQCVRALFVSSWWIARLFVLHPVQASDAMGCQVTRFGSFKVSTPMQWFDLTGSALSRRNASTKYGEREARNGLDKTKLVEAPIDSRRRRRDVEESHEFKVFCRADESVENVRHQPRRMQLTAIVREQRFASPLWQ